MNRDIENPYDRVKTRLKMRLADFVEANEELDPGRPGAQRQAAEEVLRRELQGLPDDLRQRIDLAGDATDQLIREVMDEVVGLGPLDPLLADPTLSEIMVNGPKDIYVERDGRMERIDASFRDTQHLLHVIERMLAPIGRGVNEADPLCDATLPDGSRINVAIPPIVLNGPVVTIRKKVRDWTMEEFVQLGVLSAQAAEFLQSCVRARVNIIISGGTSTGKTTLVTILSTFMPKDNRIITIENVPELELPGREHWIRMVAREGNADSRGNVPLRALVKNALRMRPDRIILGEARGGEALDVVQAMHTGHDGFITVLHANSARAALERLETMMLMSGLDLPPAACRMQIASAVDLVVHVGRFVDGSRRVETITQVHGVSQEGFELEELFVFETGDYSADGEMHGTHRYTGARPRVLSKFRLHNVQPPGWVTG
ncbi:MAG TPA: ATPase, T2SS/T4P/T4SS family [bacterium]